MPRIEPPSQGLVVTLGEGAVLVRSADVALMGQVARWLRHAILGAGEDGAPAATFDIIADGAGNDVIYLNGKAVCSPVARRFTVERLLYELTPALAATCPSSLVLHAAGLSWQEAGIIVCGPSGSGKSTLAARLAIKGCGFLSDELIAVDAEAGAMTGLPRPVAIKDRDSFAPDCDLMASAGVLRLASDLATIYWDPETLRPGCVGRSAAPALLVFPRYSPGDTPALQPVSRAEAAFRLLPRLLNPTAFPDRGLRLASALARATSAYSLAYSDSNAAAGQIMRLAEGLDAGRSPAGGER